MKQGIFSAFIVITANYFDSSKPRGLEEFWLKTGHGIFIPLSL